MPPSEKSYSLQLARLGLHAKTLPRRVHPRPSQVKASPDPEVWLRIEPPRLEALNLVLQALEPIETLAERMRVLAACAALHDDADEAAYLLSVSVEDDRTHCARCGRAQPLSRWRNR